MSFKLRQLFSAAVLLLAASSPAIATDYPKVAFNAVYGMIIPKDGHDFCVESDGVGHIREKLEVNGKSLDTLFDYRAGVMYLVMAPEKIAMKKPLVVTRVHDEESAKKFNAKSLGKKTIAGHPCSGWSYTINGSAVEIWNGDDIDWIVQEKRTRPDGTVLEVELKEVDKKPLPDSEFKLPDGCTIKEKP